MCGAEALEEVLLFGGRSREKVEQCKKSVVQPRVLSATAVMVWTAGEVEQMQRVENKVWRQILGAPG